MKWSATAWAWFSIFLLKAFVNHASQALSADPVALDKSGDDPDSFGLRQHIHALLRSRNPPKYPHKMEKTVLVSSGIPECI